MTLRLAKNVIRRNRAGIEHRPSTHKAASDRLRKAYQRRKPRRWCADLGLWPAARGDGRAFQRGSP